MGMLHISYEHRSKGMGKKMFAVVCERVRAFGARKLYISSHSSEESQAFIKPSAAQRRKRSILSQSRRSLAIAR